MALNEYSGNQRAQYLSHQLWPLSKHVTRILGSNLPALILPKGWTPPPDTAFQLKHKDWYKLHVLERGTDLKGSSDTKFIFMMLMQALNG